MRRAVSGIGKDTDPAILPRKTIPRLNDSAGIAIRQISRTLFLMSDFKVAVVGSGSVGSYYGALLSQCAEVSFLMRRDLDAVRKRGLTITSPNGDFHLDEVQAFASTAEIGPVDLVIIALKTTSNEILPEVIPPLLKESTAIMTLQNGLGNEDFLLRHFPDHPILGGMCFVCINRGEPGIVHHIAHGLVEMGALTGKHYLEIVAPLFQNAGIPCRVLGDLGLARWRKLVWNVPFNGLSIAGGGIDTKSILSSPELEARTKALMLEVIAAAACFGHEIDESFADENMKRTRDMGAYQPSSLIDFLAGDPVEVDPIWGEPLRRAKSKDVATPQLELLHREICEAVTSRAS